MASLSLMEPLVSITVSNAMQFTTITHCDSIRLLGDPMSLDKMCGSFSGYSYHYHQVLYLALQNLGWVDQRRVA